jgi:predicted outer membrane repeat protein
MFHTAGLLVVLLCTSADTKAQILNVPGDYSTIAQAISAAQTGDTVRVQPGLYEENIYWPETDSVTLESAGGSAQTTITSPADGSVIHFSQLPDSIVGAVIRGFTITGGGGIDYGGGLYLESTELSMDDVRLESNSALRSGGGIYASNSTVRLTNSTVAGNSAVGDGGGIAIAGSSILEISGSLLQDNTSDRYGGGLRIDTNSDAEVTISNVSFEHNRARWGGAIASGELGGFHITQSRIAHNTASQGTGGIDCNVRCPAEISSTVISHNRGGYGGIECANNSRCVISQSQIVDNEGTEVGGLRIHQSPVIVRDVTVANNVATKQSSYFTDVGGIGLVGVGTANLESVSVYGNSGPDADGILVMGGSTPVFGEVNIVGNGVGAGYSDNTTTLDMLDLWWGEPTGPYNARQNPGGTGDIADPFVNVIPFRIEPSVIAPPVPPRGLVAESTSRSSVRLRWAPSSLADLQGYRPYVFFSAGAEFEQNAALPVVTDTSFVWTGLEYGVSYWVTVTAVDTDGNESWAPSAVQVQTTNRPPQVEFQETVLSTDEDTALVVEATASDADGDPVALAVVREPANGTVDVMGLIGTYTPGKDFNGEDSFELAGSDGLSTSESTAFSVNVRAVNDAPTVATVVHPSDGATLAIEGSPDTGLAIDWLASADPDGDPITYSWQMALASVPDAPILIRDAGEALQISVPYGEVAAALTSAGVMTGSSVDAEHWVLSNDGSIATKGPAASLALVRGAVTLVEDAVALPEKVTLQSNYPNPFKRGTAIRFGLPEEGRVRLAIYDMLGRRVALPVDRDFPAGWHEVRFDASTLSSGLYVYRLEVNRESISRIMLLTK